MHVRTASAEKLPKKESFDFLPLADTEALFMKFILASTLSLAVLFATALLPSPAFAHGGGLDSYGCHHNRKAGGYHCHRGVFAGRSFKSKEEMLSELQRLSK